MNSKTPFKWRHYQSDIILLCVRWYLSYPLSYRQVVEMVNERGLDIHHTTVFRWVQEYSPEIDKRFRSYLRPTNDSMRVDETYILQLIAGFIPWANLSRSLCLDRISLT